MERYFFNNANWFNSHSEGFQLQEIVNLEVNEGRGVKLFMRRIISRGDWWCPHIQWLLSDDVSKVEENVDCEIRQPLIRQTHT